jgi:hypothetical protein
MPHFTVYEGVLFPYFETGCEGLVWALQRDGLDGYKGLVCLEEGDLVTIRSPEGRVLFEDTIKQDYENGTIPRYEGAKHTQVTALGYWVHWSQAGWAPDDWAKLFLEQGNRGTLRRIESAEGSSIDSRG